MTDAATAADPGAALSCPLCEYSLRGLAEPRCPECGFAFTWAELAAADRDRHRWLFEHAKRRLVGSLWTTCRHNLWPLRFWRDVTPANPVNPRRLVLYWAITALVAAVLLLAPLPHGMWQAWDEGYASPVFLSGPYALPSGPAPWTEWLADGCRGTWDVVRSADLSKLNAAGPPLLVLAWPWLSLAALLVFGLSMRRAKISSRHVLRVAVYGCDFGWLVVAAVLIALPVEAASRFWTQVPDGVPLAYLALFCGGGRDRSDVGGVRPVPAVPPAGADRAGVAGDGRRVRLDVPDADDRPGRPVPVTTACPAVAGRG